MGRTCGRQETSSIRSRYLGDGNPEEQRSVSIEEYAVRARRISSPNTLHSRFFDGLLGPPPSYASRLASFHVPASNWSRVEGITRTGSRQLAMPMRIWGAVSFAFED
ncbi:hypothetical protein RB195_000373 [Necator americanus]|uniref:Uncharacterized protein n=1 Tax=Necator americanus TaxID=51031 RepID=A0ABR1DCE6_NECAM